MFSVYLAVRKTERHILERFAVNNNNNHRTVAARNDHTSSATATSLSTARQLTMRSRRVMIKGILYIVSMAIPMVFAFFAIYIFERESYWATLFFCIVNPMQGLFNVIIYALPMILIHRDTSALAQCWANVEHSNCWLFFSGYLNGCCCCRWHSLEHGSPQEPIIRRQSIFVDHSGGNIGGNIGGNNIQDVPSIFAEVRFSSFSQHCFLSDDEKETREDKHNTSPLVLSLSQAQHDQQLDTIRGDENLYDLDGSCGVATILDNLELGNLHDAQQVSDTFSNANGEDF